MDITTLRIIATLLSLATFLGILIWACLPRKSAEFEAASRLPFDPSGDGDTR